MNLSSKKIFFLLIMSAFALPSAHAKGVLFFGDSHVPGPFGKALDKLLRTDPKLSVETYGVASAVAKSFLKPYTTTRGYFFHVEDNKPEVGTTGPAPDISKVFDTMKPELTVVELGTNYWGDSDEGIKTDVQNLMTVIRKSGSQCVWVSMPDTRLAKVHSQQTRIANAIKEVIGTDCSFVDSTLLTKYPAKGGDGIHYWIPKFAPIAMEWANKVYTEHLKSILPTP